MIEIHIPYAEDGNLGAAYNRILNWAVEPWVLFLDHDVFLRLNPHWYYLCCKAIERRPSTGIFTTWTNRTFANPQTQLVPSQFGNYQSNNIDTHRSIARSVFEFYRYELIQVDKPITGMFMLINVEAVDGVRFDNGFFGIDHKFCNDVLRTNLHINLIAGLYVYHLLDRNEENWIAGQKTSNQLYKERSHVGRREDSSS